MIRILVAFIFISIVSISPAPVSGQWGATHKPNPELAGKKIINKITLYNASKYDSKKSAQLIAHERIKREIIEALRMDILSSYSKECPVQSPVVSQDYAILVSSIMKTEEGASDWDDGVLEYQLALGISISDFAKILCVASHDSNLLMVIEKFRKRVDDPLAIIEQLQYGSYDESKQGAYDRAVNSIRAANYFKEGVLAGLYKDPETALDAYENALRFYPGFPEAFYQRAELYRSMSRNQEAITEYSQAIKYDNNEANYYISRGICYFDMGQPDPAMKDFDHVIDMKPSAPVLFAAYAARGNIYERNEEDQKALQDYTKATELNPKAADIYFRKGLLNRNLKNYEDAVKDFNMVIELEKNPSDAYYERGTTYAYLGDKQKVMDDYKSAARLGSNEARKVLNKHNIEWE